MLPKNRPPTTPGEVLVEEFLKPLSMTQLTLAAKMRVPTQRVNALVHGRRGVTAETAILLSRALKTSPEFWMNLQVRCDLWEAQRKLAV
ncbi:HigA family addiction module antitoxin [Polyangium fumosum]|uniref:Addiction module antidote protein, HigA family n=1 Tax=Polyangium fumosum TaxID=889272 RepID=A0A4U1JII2_9BACT|nr:HigA family addiction module antitoxin [Polyangium fumosum]TKD12468.1 addiction module antidote protein, HigA family [Polyangium fumosum]